jgi:hypothetical protein
MLDLALHALHHFDISSYTTFRALDQVHVEPVSEVQVEQDQVEDFTNLDLNQGKPWYINPCSLYFILNIYFMFYFGCAL